MKTAFHRFAKGPGDMVILGLLTKKPMYGYQMFQTLCESESRIIHVLCMGEGTLYPLLYRLEKKGLIKGQWIKVGKKRKQRHYHITPKGVTEYNRLRKCWATLMRAVHKICGYKI